MRNAALTALSLLALAACSPEIPDSGAQANRAPATPVDVGPLGAADTAAAVLGVASPGATAQPPAAGTAPSPTAPTASAS